MDDYIPTSEAVYVHMSDEETDVACEDYLREFPSSYVQINDVWYSTDHRIVREQREQINNEQTAEERDHEQQSLF